VLKQSPRSFVTELDFCTSAGFSGGGGERAQSGATGAGPQAVITDFGILKPIAGSEELQLTARFENVTPQQAVRATGWPLQLADEIDVIAAPTADELLVLREMHARTRKSR
jgi:glutaconate CoA-transferase, subunit B